MQFSPYILILHFGYNLSTYIIAENKLFLTPSDSSAYVWISFWENKFPGNWPLIAVYMHQDLKKCSYCRIELLDALVPDQKYKEYALW